MSEPKFVEEFSNQSELNLANWNDGKQIIKIKLMQIKLEGKGQRASYKLDAGQRPCRNESLQLEERIKRKREKALELRIKIVFRKK